MALTSEALIGKMLDLFGERKTYLLTGMVTAPEMEDSTATTAVETLVAVPDVDHHLGVKLLSRGTATTTTTMGFSCGKSKPGYAAAAPSPTTTEESLVAVPGTKPHLAGTTTTTSKLVLDRGLAAVASTTISVVPSNINANAPASCSTKCPSRVVKVVAPATAYYSSKDLVIPPWPPPVMEMLFWLGVTKVLVNALPSSGCTLWLQRPGDVYGSCYGNLQATSLHKAHLLDTMFEPCCNSHKTGYSGKMGNSKVQHNVWHDTHDNILLPCPATNTCDTHHMLQLWQSFVGTGARRINGNYDSLAAEAKVENNKCQDSSTSEAAHEKWIGQIEKDLPRTFPGYPALEEDGRNALRRLLIAYARHNPSVGYCQAMNFFAGLVFLLMLEENAFWTLVGIIDDYFDGYFSEEMFESRLWDPGLTAGLRFLALGRSHADFRWDPGSPTSLQLIEPVGSGADFASLCVLRIPILLMTQRKCGGCHGRDIFVHVLPCSGYSYLLHFADNCGSWSPSLLFVVLVFYQKAAQGIYGIIGAICLSGEPQLQTNEHEGSHVSVGYEDDYVMMDDRVQPVYEHLIEMNSFEGIPAVHLVQATNTADGSVMMSEVPSLGEQFPECMSISNPIQGPYVLQLVHSGSSSSCTAIEVADKLSGYSSLSKSLLVMLAYGAQGMSNSQFLIVMWAIQASNLFKKIKGGIYTLPSHLSAWARDLIPRLLIADRMTRITIHEFQGHQCFQFQICFALFVLKSDHQADFLTLHIDGTIMNYDHNLALLGIHGAAHLHIMNHGLQSVEKHAQESLTKLCLPALILYGICATVMAFKPWEFSSCTVDRIVSTLLIPWYVGLHTEEKQDEFHSGCKCSRAKCGKKKYKYRS